MKFALPVVQGKLCMHFGHSEKFALIEADMNTGEILSEDYLVPPPHEPGVLPAWLAEKGAQCIISGGMGQMAQRLFAENNIEVVTGAPPEEPRKIVSAYLNKVLTTGDNPCTSGEHDCDH